MLKRNGFAGDLAISSVPVLTIEQYFHQEITLLVPPWQREYTWKATDEGEVGDLLADLKEFVESNAEEYLLGAVILGDSGQTTSKMIIDGQQRTVTMSLLFMCCYRHINRSHLWGADDIKFKSALVSVFDKGDWKGSEGAADDMGLRLGL